MASPLDFWPGSWIVHDRATGEYAGANEIASLLDSNAVVEQWRGSSCLEGTSLFFLDRAADTWRQVWATSAGWAKEKALVPAPPGSTRFGGIVTMPNGVQVRGRTTLTLRDDGSVRQVIETSPVDGE